MIKYDSCTFIALKRLLSFRAKGSLIQTCLISSYKSQQKHLTHHSFPSSLSPWRQKEREKKAESRYCHSSKDLRQTGSVRNFDSNCLSWLSRSHMQIELEILIKQNFQRTALINPKRSSEKENGFLFKCYLRYMTVEQDRVSHAPSTFDSPELLATNGCDITGI